ncbi:caveolin-2-like [Carassius carassius]|uniref:caveolin-2-like n=1 Tax=Carassius carassius TaxID=217509 RepID=UPI0028691044|nr:caveolin-2-like [Carassius carassius]
MSHLGVSDFISYWEDALQFCSQCVHRQTLRQSHKHTLMLLHTMDQGAPLKEISIDMEINEEEEEVSSLLDQREINPNDAPGVTEAHTKGQDSSAPHSNTKALIKDRDPKGINKCLKVTFEDVLAEPASVRSFDKVWLWSHALFEVSRLWFYRIVSLLLAVPVALAAGLLFAVLSCLHIWLIVPSVQLLVINLHWIKVVWYNVLKIAISPFFRSFGKCCGFIRISLKKC